MRRGGSYNNAIWCVNVLLALGIFAFAFKFIFFVKGDESWPENPPAPASNTGPVDTGMKEYEAIYSSQLVPQAPGPPKPVEQWPSIQYTGVFGSQILFSVGNAEGQGKVGSPIQVPENGGWKDVEVNGKKVIVKEVLPDKIRLQLEGTNEEKDIPTLNETPSAPTPQTPAGATPMEQPGPVPGKAPDVGLAPKQTKENQWKIDPSDRDFVRDHGEELAKDVKWSLYGVENGKAKGVRIEGFTQGSYAEDYAAKHGIKAGDILLSINGKTIDGADTVNHMFGDGQAWDQGKAQVEVERAGKVQVISYAVK